MKALIIVDVQNDFLPGGALAVPNGDHIVPYINDIMKNYEHVIVTQDWHPADHQSFAGNHTGAAIGDVIDLHGIQQILWPIHCVQGTNGAALAENLKTGTTEKYIFKGTDPTVDSYSAFFDNEKRNSTELHEYLQAQNVTEVDIVGLATDYCVKFTALDAVELGYKTVVLITGCRGVNLQEGDVDRAIQEMKDAGVIVR